MKKEAQLTNEIKKLQYQLSYSEHISIPSPNQTNNYLNNCPSCAKKPVFQFAKLSLLRT